jgi:hypothetical protein
MLHNDLLLRLHEKLLCLVAAFKDAAQRRYHVIKEGAIRPGFNGAILNSLNPFSLGHRPHLLTPFGKNRRAVGKDCPHRSHQGLGIFGKPGGLARARYLVKNL